MVKDYFYIQNFLHGNFTILKFLYIKISLWYHIITVNVRVTYPDDARAVGSSLRRRHRGQRSGVKGQRIPSGLGCRGSGGGGGTGRDVSLFTASLLSAEYHHSRSFNRNTPRGMRLAAICCKTDTEAWGESRVVISSPICRDRVTPASKKKKQTVICAVNTIISDSLPTC